VVLRVQDLVIVIQLHSLETVDNQVLQAHRKPDLTVKILLNILAELVARQLQILAVAAAVGLGILEMVLMVEVLALLDLAHLQTLVQAAVVAAAV
jgi:hypothetical protein